MTELRDAVADLLDEAHGPNVTEGGCDFRAAWWPDRRYVRADDERRYDDVVDQLIGLVRESDRPVIDNIEELRALPTDSVVLAPTGTIFVKDVYGEWRWGPGNTCDSYLLLESWYVSQPIRLIHQGERRG